MRAERTAVFALMAGGGTGGHVNPALAIADALVDRGHDKDSILFVGSARGLEATLVPKAGYRVRLLPGRGIRRRLSLSSIFAVAGLLVALARALFLVGRLRPKVVVSVGGYASAPCAIAAVVLRVPLVLAESNAVPGAANRLVARLAKASAIALPGTPLPRAVLTGNPVRPSIAYLDRSPEAVAAARDKLGLPPDRVVIGVFGGSLGATRINTATFELVERWRDRSDVAIRHAVGRRDWGKPDLVPPTVDGSGLVSEPLEYEDHMETLLAAADIVVCRSGASTVAEIAAAGLTSVLVPFPLATGDHQTANARTLEKAGASVLVPDSACDGEMLEGVLSPLISDPDRLKAMALAAKSLAVPDAADRVAALVEENARG